MSAPVTTPPAPITGMSTASTISGSRSRMIRSVPRCPPASKPSTTTAAAPNFSDELGDARAADDRDHRDTSLSAPREDVAREAGTGDDEVDAFVERRLDHLAKRPNGDHDVDADDPVSQRRAPCESRRASSSGRQTASGDDADAARLGDRSRQRRQRDANRHAALDDGQSGGSISDRERGHVHVADLSGSQASRGDATTPGGATAATGWIRMLGLAVGIDVGDSIADGLDALSILVGDGDAELLLKRHDELDDVERVGAEVVDERRVFD